MLLQKIFNQGLKFRSLISLSQAFAANGTLTKQIPLDLSKQITYPQVKDYFPEGVPSTFDTYTLPPKDLMKKAFGSNTQKQRRVAYLQIEKGGQVYHIFDASKIALGTMCQKIAYYIQGKHKPTYSRSSWDCGDKCIVVNSADILLTGKKAYSKDIIYHSGFIGHLHTIPYKRFLLEKPEQLIFWNVFRMLPRNKNRKKFLKKLEVFRTINHNKHGLLPNILSYQQTNDSNNELNPKNFTSDTIITYHSDKEIPQEFKHLKIEIDKEIEIPLENRQKVFKMTDHNKRAIKEWNRYNKQLQRTKLHKPKPPKNRDPNLNNDTILVESQNYLQRYKLEKYIPGEEVAEDDDEILKKKI